MIDFRYHIVSLIAVFLALAVGIVLGAGPLRDYIADSLSGQVDQLREETEQLRSERDRLETHLSDATQFIHETRPTLVSGVLPNYNVSIIAMPGVATSAVTSVRDVIAEAGGSVLNIITVGDDFVDPAKRSFRSGIAGNITGYMDPQPSADASAEAIIGTAIGQAVSGYDPQDPQQPSENALAITELLTTSELITLDSAIVPTHLTLVLTAADETEPEVLAAGLGLIKGLDPATTVISGDAGADTLLELVRTDSDAAAAYTSTDSASTEPGILSVPRALAVVVDGGSGTFGFQTGATAAFPPTVDIGPPAAIEPREDEADSEAEEDAEEEDAAA